MSLIINERENILKDILGKAKRDDVGTYLIAPRFGKSRLLIELIKKFKYKKVLWVTPNTKLRDEDIPNEFIKWKAKTYLKKTTTICYSSLKKQSGEYDLIVLDEVQCLTLLQANRLLSKKLTYKSLIGLTGTLPKHKIKLDILSYLGLDKILKEVSINEAIDNNIVADYKVMTIGIPIDSLNKTILSGNKTKSFYQTEYQKYQYLTKMCEDTMSTSAFLRRMRFIHNLPSKLNYAKAILPKLTGRTLIFCSNINQSSQLNVPTFNSKTNKENLNKFVNEEINTLALVNAGGVGYTFHNIDNVLIIQADSNKNGLSLQKVARSLIYRPNYIAKIYILYAKDTVDKKWVFSLLEDLDSNKVKHYNL